MSQNEAEHVMRLLQEGKEWSGQFLVRHRDGSPLKVHVSDRPVLRNGRRVGIIGISRRIDQARVAPSSGVPL